MDRQALTEAFRTHFGGDPQIFAVAPGRINLIGEHTDYNEGFVFPAAIDRHLYVAAAPTDSESELFSLQMGRAKPFDATTIMPGEIDDWAAYGAGMAWVLRDRGAVKNVRAIVHSEVPIGSGVSSSAALELAFGLVFAQTATISIPNQELALLAQKDENQFVGVNSGIMDQMASAMGKTDMAMFLDTRSLEITYAPVPEDLLIVLLDTKTPRQLTDSAYNERRRQCEEAARAMGVKALRDADMHLLDEVEGSVSSVVFRRAKHVITENARCVNFAKALEAGDKPALGVLMRESHQSLRDDYEVSSRELDIMAEAAWEAPGCVGARMTGAGFGGACVALVERKQFADFAKSVNLRYSHSSGHTGEVLPCRAVEGARLI